MVSWETLMSKRLLLLVVASLLVLVLAACSTESADDTTAADDTEEVIDEPTPEPTPEPTETPEPTPEPTPTAEPTPTPEPEPTPTQEPTPEPTPETSESTRDNPVLFGETAMIRDWEVRVLEIYPDATEMVMDENQFNDPPRNDHQFFIARVEATYTGPDYDNFDGRFSLRAVGESAVSYSTYLDRCGVYPDELEDPDVYEGGTIEGNVCWEIRSSDADSLIMFYDDLLFDTDREYFALYEGDPLPIPDAGDPPGEPLDDGVGSRDNPVPMNTWAEINDGWYMRVVDTVPDAEEMILEHNQFNDPPDDGRQFFIAVIEAAYFGSSSDRFDGRYTLHALGDESIAYSVFADSCGVIPDEIQDPETFPGGTITGNICWSIRSADADSLVTFEDVFFSNEDRIYFALN
jgi:hypothetical protein